MPPFPAQIQLARSVRLGDLPLGKLHAQLDQFSNPRRPFLNNRAHHFLMAQPRPRLERVAHVQLERILLRRDRRDAALRVVGVRFRAIFFRDDGHAPARRDLQREGQARDAAAEDQEIELFHLLPLPPEHSHLRKSDPRGPLGKWG